MSEAVAGVGGGDLVEDGLHRFPQGVAGAAGQRSQQVFDLGELVPLTEPEVQRLLVAIV